MKKITAFGILALFLVSVVAAGAFAFPFDGKGKRAGFENKSFEAMKEKRAEKQAMMDEICETGVIPDDFEGPRAQWLEENLDAVCQLHEARQDGAEHEELKELAQELGLQKPKGKMKKMHKHRNKMFG